MSLIRRNFTRGRRLTGTLNNPSVDERADFVALCTDDGHSTMIKYIVFQSEVGASGVHHLQFYVIFSESVRARQAHAVLGPRVHFDASRGTPAQNKHYCQKPLDGCDCQHCRDARALPNDGREVAPQFISGEYGRVRAPRTDSLKSVVEMMAPGTASLGEVLDAHPEQAIKYGKKIRQEFARRIKPRDWAMDIEIFVGETATGKSSTATVENPDSVVIPWPTGNRWWFAGYTGQRCIVLDDFRTGNISVLTMMRLFDRIGWQVELKGSNFPFVSRKIVITTNVDPKDWYQMTKLVESKGQQARHDILAPLARRISEFATIYDFAPGHVYDASLPGNGFVKVARPKTGGRLTWFHFNDADVMDLSTDRDDGRSDQFAVYGA